MSNPTSKNKNNTFFGGAAILAAGIVIVKLIGALYKIPLGNILGGAGLALLLWYCHLKQGGTPS